MLLIAHDLLHQHLYYDGYRGRQIPFTWFTYFVFDLIVAASNLLCILDYCLLNSNSHHRPRILRHDSITRQ